MPPPEFVRIRYYGFLSHAKKGKLLPKIKLNLEAKIVPKKQLAATITPEQKIKLSPCCQALVKIQLLEKVPLTTFNPWNST